MSRVETGPVQFDDDWPGVFIRGDNAFGYAITLGGIAAAIEAGLAVPRLYLIGLKDLAALLASAQVAAGKEPEGLQIVRRQLAEPEREEVGR